MENKFCSGCSQWIPDVTQKNGVCQSSILSNTLPDIPGSVGTVLFPVLVTSQYFGCIYFASKEKPDAMDKEASPLPSEQREPADGRAAGQNEAGVARQPGADSQRPGDEAEEVPQAPVDEGKYCATTIARVILLEMLKHTDWPEMESIAVDHDAESSAAMFDHDRRICVGVTVRPAEDHYVVRCKAKPVRGPALIGEYDATAMERHFKDLGIEGIQVAYAMPAVRQMRAALKLP